MNVVHENVMKCQSTIKVGKVRWVIINRNQLAIITECHILCMCLFLFADNVPQWPVTSVTSTAYM